VGLTAAASGVLAANRSAAAAATTGEPRQTGPATVRGAFIYPPTAALDAVGYYSWPGSTFDAEGQQKKYAAQLATMANDLDMHIEMDVKALDEMSDVDAFIADVKKTRPDGLLLILFKKGHWNRVLRIVDETEIPSVVLTPLGVLLSPHIRQMHRRPGTYLVSANGADSVEPGLRMIRAARRLSAARLLRVAGSSTGEDTVAHLGTQVRTIPRERFIETFNGLEVEGPVADLARAYRRNARKIVEPSREDIGDAAKTYFTLKSLVEKEDADAVMMDCLPGLQKPHKHAPPCMGFMTLRDEGIPAGCQADLSATLTLMLVQELFGKPGFQQNASMNTAANLYFGAHCTSPSKMNGPNEDPEAYDLRSHAEAGWGCVPRVLFREGQPVTLAQYLPREKPQMIVYTGEIVGCPPIPPTGGCRTNLEMTINEVDDVCDVQGMHQAIFYGNHGNDLRRFCQLYGIEVVT
jgi:hypothetical protein